MEDVDKKYSILLNAFYTLKSATELIYVEFPVLHISPCTSFKVHVCSAFSIPQHIAIYVDANSRTNVLQKDISAQICVIPCARIKKMRAH